MSTASRRLAGILLIVMPTVTYGGVSLLAAGLLVLGVGLVRGNRQ